MIRINTSPICMDLFGPTNWTFSPFLFLVESRNQYLLILEATSLWKKIMFIVQSKADGRPWISETKDWHDKIHFWLDSYKIKFGWETFISHWFTHFHPSIYRLQINGYSIQSTSLRGMDSQSTPCLKVQTTKIRSHVQVLRSRPYNLSFSGLFMIFQMKLRGYIQDMEYSQDTAPSFFLFCFWGGRLHCHVTI